VYNTTGGSGAVENIFFNDTLSSGNYEYYVNHFSGASGSFTIKVYKEGVLVDTQTGSLSDGESTHFNYNHAP
jgi:hypothetical protein